MRQKRKNKIIIFSLLGLLCLMTAGYAAFQTNLKIKGTSGISSNWDIKITNVTKSNEAGGAEEVKAPTWTDLTAYMEANLYEKGDSIEYDVTVENNGTIDASLDNVSENIKSTNEAVKITFSGYTKGEKLFKNSSQIIKVKIEYNPDFNGTPEEGSGEISVDLNYTQAEGGTITPTDKYLVTYDCTTNGGKDCTNYNEYLNEGDSVNLNYTSNKEEYEFIGWNTNKDAEEGLTELNMLNQDITLYAIFKAIAPQTFTLTYNYNGATGGNTDQSKTVEYQKPYGTLPTPTRSYAVTYNYNGATGGNNVTSTSSNYTFNGWYNESTYINKIDSTDTYILTNDSTIYASWTETQVTLPTPTKTGYVFSGWYSDSGLTQKVGDAGAKYTPTSNITLYAKWIDNIKPTVSLNPNTQTTYVKSKAVTVNLADAGSGLKASQNIYYAWSTSNTTAPSYSSYVTTTNAAGAKTASVTVPATSNSSLTGTYYLWIKVGTLSDVSGNTSNQAVSALFKFDNTVPTGSISFTGSLGTSGSNNDNVYVTGTSWGATPYASASSSDGHSGVKTTSLSCTSSNTNVATVANNNFGQAVITIKSRKGTANNYQYLQETATINCTLTVTDNAGNSKSVSLSKLAGNGWFPGGNLTCSTGKGGSYKNWYYANGLNKAVGWIYTYHPTLKTNIYYYTNSNGLMVRGWQQIGGTWYYLNDYCTYNMTYKTTSGYQYPDGGMIWNDTLIRKSDNAQWKFDSNGKCTSGSGC